MDFLEKYREQCYAALRIVSGFMFIFHGVQKLAKVMDGTAMWIHQIAGPIEVIGGALIMIGLYTSRAAFLASGLMASAYWYAHASRGGWPIDNGGELAIMFCFAFLYIASRGSGMWSVDSKRS